MAAKIDSRCPRKLSHLPNELCEVGKKSCEANSLEDLKPKDRCEWWINDKESHYCFWVHMNKNHGIETPLQRIAHLINSNISTVNLLINKALEKLKKKLPNIKLIKQLFNLED